MCCMILAAVFRPFREPVTLVAGTLLAVPGGEALVGGAVAAAEVVPAAGWLLVFN